MKKICVFCFALGILILCIGISLHIFNFMDSNDTQPESPSIDDIEENNNSNSLNSNSEIQIEATITDKVNVNQFQLNDYYFYQVRFLTQNNVLYVAISNVKEETISWQQIMITGQQNGKDLLTCSYSGLVELLPNESIILECKADIDFNNVMYGFSAY